MLEQAAEGIFILDEKLNYIEVNPYYEKLTGFSKSELLSQQLFNITINQKLQQQQFHDSITQQLLKLANICNLMKSLHRVKVSIYGFILMQLKMSTIKLLIILVLHVI